MLFNLEILGLNHICNYLMHSILQDLFIIGFNGKMSNGSNISHCQSGNSVYSLRYLSVSTDSVCYFKQGCRFLSRGGEDEAPKLTRPQWLMLSRRVSVRQI